MIFGDFVGNSGDTEGRHLNAGNFTVNSYTGYTVGYSVIGTKNPPEAGRDDLIIGGNFIGTGSPTGEIANTSEDVVLGGSILSGTIGVNSTPGFLEQSSGQGTLTENAGMFDLDSATGNVVPYGNGVSLDALLGNIQLEATALSQRPDSAGVTVNDDGYGTVTLTFPAGINTYVYTVTEDLWDGTKWRTVNADAGSTVILNVPGTDIGLQGTFALGGGVSQSHVLINYFEADTWSMSGMDHQGTVLAVETSSVSQSGGGINGVAIFTGTVTKTNGGEFHNFLFGGDLGLSQIPEPSALLLTVLPALLLLGRRRGAVTSQS
jgi:choice-of-anchor A domain-containing protein